MFAKQFIQISSSIWLISASFSLISVSSPVCISSLCKQHQVSIVEDCILSGLPASPLWFRVNILFNEIKWACLSASLSLFLLSMLKCPFSLSPLTSLPVSFLARKQHVENRDHLKWASIVIELARLHVWWQYGMFWVWYAWIHLVMRSSCNTLGPGAHWLQRYFRCFCILIMNNNEVV